MGAKKKHGVPDLAVILSTSERPTTTAWCFIRNAFKAAPVIVSNAILKRNGGYARAVVMNSVYANAVRRKQGLDDAWAMVKETDSLLHKRSCTKFEHETLVMSTGVIGQNLPISKIVAGIRSQSDKESSTRILGFDFTAWERAAQAFMTTDTFPKLRSRSFTTAGFEYRLAGMDKGAGMIHPNMGPAGTSFASPKQLHATLLGCIMTDAAVLAVFRVHSHMQLTEASILSVSTVTCQQTIRSTSWQTGRSPMDSRSTKRTLKTLMKSSSTN